jgi:hypothetical protein
MNEMEVLVEWHQGVLGCNIWYQNSFLRLIGKSSKAYGEGKNNPKANDFG